MTERTSDGRYIVVDGRRWRASDPSIPEKLRAELVAELMSARRAVKTDGDAARPRVHDAKVALGERGEPWWDDPSDAGRGERIVAAMRTLLRHRDAESSICPSDVARVVGGKGWRDAMDLVRTVAGELAAAGVVRVTKGEQDVSVTVGGPLRLRRGPRWTDT